MNNSTMIFALLVMSVLPISANAQDWACSNHSISMSTSLGVDYTYEQKLAKCFSMVFRGGIGTSGIWVINAEMDSFLLQGHFSYPAANSSIEPRLYTNLRHRQILNKTTYNNSADYIALRMTGARGIISKSTEFCLVPMYGIRRALEEHIFGEFTIGAGATWFRSSLFIKPHLSLRIGYAF